MQKRASWDCVKQMPSRKQRGIFFKKIFSINGRGSGGGGRSFFSPPIKTPQQGGGLRKINRKDAKFLREEKCVNKAGPRKGLRYGCYLATASNKQAVYYGSCGLAAPTNPG